MKWHMSSDFGHHTHGQLYAMLFAGVPDSARTAASTWADTGNFLHEQANRLERQMSGFSEQWTGTAANQYQTMINDLIMGLRKVGDTAYSMRDMTEDAADAQETARREMPAPVDVPVVAPATAALASAPIQVDANTPATVVAQIQQARSAAIAAVQGQQAASAASDAAHTRAIQVMQALAGNYVNSENAIPPAPDGQVITMSGVTTPTAQATPTSHTGARLASTTGIRNTSDPLWDSASGTLTDPSGPAGAAPGKDPVTGQLLASGGSSTTTKPPSNPLFGDMFTAGVAAASAAVFGRFGSVIPRVPKFAARGQDPNAQGAEPVDPNNPPKLGDRILASAQGTPGFSDTPGVSGGAAAGTEAAAAAAALRSSGGIGGAGGFHIGGGGAHLGGIGGVGGGAGGAGPTTSPSLLGTTANSVGTDLATGMGAAAGAAARGSAGMPMMPMMPMGGMGGGGDMGGGRRIPPWLVETEDVWGESSAVAPTVIGEEPDTGGGWLG